MVTEGALPAATAMGRIALRVNELDRVAEFYETVLGFDVGEHGQRRAILSAGGEALVVLVQDPDAPPREPDETGLFHAAFLVPSRAALGDALERIERHWRLDGTADHVVSEALYLSDPEGNGIEVYRDRSRETWPVAEDGRIGIDTIPLDVEGVRSAASEREAAPAATTLGHVHLEVSSIAAARSFYVDALGMDVKQRFGGSALFVAAGGYHHHLGLNVWENRSSPPRGRGLEWFELVVPDADALDAVRTRLERRGFATEDGAGEGFETIDPDGIRLRLRSETSR